MQKSVVIDDKGTIRCPLNRNFLVIPLIKTGLELFERSELIVRRRI